MPNVKEVLEFAGEEVLQDAVDDLYLQLQGLSEALTKETRIALDYQKQRDELRTVLEQIYEMAAEDLRQGRTYVSHSYMSQIEAIARAALSPPVEPQGRRI